NPPPNRTVDTGSRQSEQGPTHRQTAEGGGKMNRHSRVLLVRLTRINASIGDVILALLDSGEPFATAKLREAGHALRCLGNDLITHADEVDRAHTSDAHTTEAPADV